MIPPSLPGVFWVKLVAFNIIWMQGQCLIQSEAVGERIPLPLETRLTNASGYKETPIGLHRAGTQKPVYHGNAADTWIPHTSLGSL